MRERTDISVSPALRAEARACTGPLGRRVVGFSITPQATVSWAALAERLIADDSVDGIVLQGPRQSTRRARQILRHLKPDTAARVRNWCGAVSARQEPAFCAEYGALLAGEPDAAWESVRDGLVWPSVVPERFSVVIPTWKNLAYLDLAVRSLRAHSALTHEIIIFFNEVDDACIQWAQGKDVHVVSDARNVGVCAAVNRAVAKATCERICFFNDDMVALPGWDTELMRYLVPGALQWLSGTAVEPGEATVCYIGQQDYGRTVETFDEAGMVSACDGLRRTYNMVSTWTPLLVAKADWDAVGGFDEAYFPGYGSDPDLAMNFYRRGCRAFVGVGSSLVYHFSRRTISRFDTAGLADPSAVFRAKWGMRWRKFFRKSMFRDRMVTPSLLEKAVQRGLTVPEGERA